MKKLLFFFLITSSVIYSQNFLRSNSLKLKNDSKHLITSNRNYPTMFQNEFHKKNTGLAILYSLLLPGMGELYAGSYSSGKYFTIADVLLWGTYAGFNSYGNWKKSNYKTYAASNGGVNNSGKDANYYATIGDYLSINQYNDQKALERNYTQLYNVNQYYWKWDSNEERRTYRNMWTSSESAYNNLRFVAGALILNRIASAINAVRLVSAYNKRGDTELGWNLSVGVNNSPTLPTSVTVNLLTKF